MKYIIIAIIYLNWTPMLLGANFEWHKHLNRQRALVEEFRKDSLDDGVVISLGRDCQVSTMMKVQNKRSYSFPFDWLLSSSVGVIHSFQTDFIDFFEITNMTKHRFGYLLDKDRSLHYFHIPIQFSGWDVDEVKGLVALDLDARQSYVSIKEAFFRRIARLYAFLESDIPVSLIRYSNHCESKENFPNECETLFHLLVSKFPSSNFKLICVEENETKQGAPKINDPRFIYCPLPIERQVPRGCEVHLYDCIAKYALPRDLEMTGEEWVERKYSN